MTVREIPRIHWREFLRSFSSAHRGQDVLVNAGRTGGARRHIHHGSLRNVSVALRTSHPDSVSVSIGEGLDTEIVRRIGTPSHMHVYVRPNGAQEALEILTQNGESIWVRIQPRHPAHEHREHHAAVRAKHLPHS